MKDKDVFFYGEVEIGEGSSIQDNVILGSGERGKLKIGENALIRSGTVIYSGVEIGRNFRTGHGVLIRENTEICDNVLVGTNSVIDGDCRIGNEVSIQTNVYITRYTVVEEGVFFGPCAVTLNDKYMEYGADLKGPVIKKGAKIGANSTIFPAVVIGENAVVGAGSVVTKDVKAGEVVVGNPARRLK
jgi:acetyltransferase-like isoleucine patch superfamily enzyme